MLKKTVIVLGFACAVWAFCGALVGIGRQFLSMDSTLILHAIGAPIGAAFFSSLYFRNYNFTSPLVTGAVFVGVALALDFFVVALLIEKSFGMFASVLGVWIPQALIFSASYLTGRSIEARTASAQEKGALK
ncbi:MAG: hypothetical protein OEQ29_24465 [Alphaproteobacteria bacterium]|nr:hypothetical protein [Alphaproteobacteria bacterium]